MKRYDDEDFEGYKARRKLAKELERQRLKGVMVFESRSVPFKGEDGKETVECRTLKKRQ
jgi:hypothetical protein